MIHQEIDEGLKFLSQRLKNFHTRAAVLITSSGALGVFSAEKWDTPWRTAGVSLAFVAGVIGVIALRPTWGTHIDPTRMWLERLVAEPYDLEFGLVKDKATLYKWTLNRVEKVGQLIIWGYGILMLSLLATFIVAVFSNLRTT